MFNICITGTTFVVEGGTVKVNSGFQAVAGFFRRGLESLTALAQSQRWHSERSATHVVKSRPAVICKSVWRKVEQNGERSQRVAGGGFHKIRKIGGEWQ